MGAFSLRGKVAVVTGAAGLLGRQHVAALAGAGADVVALDILPEERLARAFADDERGKGSASIVPKSCDITDAGSIARLRDFIIQRFTHIDILVNNAAINEMVEQPDAATASVKFENFPLDAWERSVRVNLTGTFLCSQVFGSVMAERKSGSIINIASTYGIVAPDQGLYVREDGRRTMIKSPAYSATKGAVLAFTKYLAAYWGRAGVRVNALSPGGVENGQEEDFIDRYAGRTMLGRMARADEYRGALIFLAGDESSYMTGANLVVDGGWTAW